ncbi:MAG: carbon-nitrogen hydrolase family protein [Candidatus Thorarchaeota archaeon]
MIRVACIQPQILNNIEKSYEEVEHLLKLLLEESKTCDLICLPERWVPLEEMNGKKFQEERGPIYNFLKKLSKNYTTALISGGIWEKRKDSNKPRITSYFFNEFGEEMGRQDKIHLYAYEKEYFEPSNEVNLFPIKHYYFAILICFDMAFFETPRIATEHGAAMLISPTQIREEGIENWNIYLKARALENRVPVIACNSFGEFYNRKFTGESKIISFVQDFISPSKLKITEAPINSSGYIYDDLDLNFPNKLRSIRFGEIVKKDQLVIRKHD